METAQSLTPDTPEPTASDVDPYLSSRQVRHLCGNIHDETLRRWRKRVELKFPKSTTVNGYHYWRQSEILAWWENQGGRLDP